MFRKKRNEVGHRRVFGQMPRTAVLKKHARKLRLRINFLRREGDKRENVLLSEEEAIGFWHIEKCDLGGVAQCFGWFVS